MCFSLVSKKQKFPLKRTTFFTLTLFSKNKGTMDKRVTEELHVRDFFFSLKFFRRKVRAPVYQVEDGECQVTSAKRRVSSAK